MAPIPFLIIFSQRTNVIKVFGEFLEPIQQEAKFNLTEDKAKKGFISSLIGVVSTFILSYFIEILKNGSDLGKFISSSYFWNFFSLLTLLFLFLIILIYYYQYLSNHIDKE
jgi:ABC-type multidrug transport system fused ATPase/permease subunit